MKTRILLMMILLSLAILLPSRARAQMPPSDDSLIRVGNGVDHGSQFNLEVQKLNKLRAFVKVDLSSLPSGVTGAW
jgi:hypothetical protein